MSTCVLRTRSGKGNWLTPSDVWSDGVTLRPLLLEWLNEWGWMKS